MLENERKQDDLLGATDSLEAIGAFKAMKNFLFAVAIICLLALQLSFWLADRGFVSGIGKADVSSPATTTEPQADVQPTAKSDKIEVAVQEATRKLKEQKDAESKQSAEQVEPKPAKRFSIKFSVLAWIIRFCNIALILTATLYCLTVLFALKISLVGRLGGINHISRAFLLSLFVLVFLFPWQKLFSGVIAGAIYTPAELAGAVRPVPEPQIAIWSAVYYIRYVGLAVIAFLLLVGAQVRTIRWAKATLRRLEVI